MFFSTVSQWQRGNVHWNLLWGQHFKEISLLDKYKEAPHFLKMYSWGYMWKVRTVPEIDI